MSSKVLDNYLMDQRDSSLTTFEGFFKPDQSENIFKDPLTSDSALEKMTDSIFVLGNGWIINEKWENSYLLSGRISAITQDFVECETIIDKHAKKTQLRKYPINLFIHLPVQKIGSTVRIKINEKRGSFKIDVIDGSNMGIEKEFEEIANWDELNDFEMDNPSDLGNA